MAYHMHSSLSKIQYKVHLIIQNLNSLIIKLMNIFSKNLRFFHLKFCIVTISTPCCILTTFWKCWQWGLKFLLGNHLNLEPSLKVYLKNYLKNYKKKLSQHTWGKKINRQKENSQIKILHTASGLIQGKWTILRTLKTIF